MSHTFADYGNRNILTPGRTGPGMTGDVMGQGDRQAQFFSDSFQISVDTMGCVDILLSLVHARSGDNGKKVREYCYGPRSPACTAPILQKVVDRFFSAGMRGCRC